MRQIATWLASIIILLAASTTFATAPAVHPEPTVTSTVKAEAPHETAVDPAKEEVNLGTFVVTIIIFVVLLGLLRVVAWKPIMTGLQSREKAIRDSIEAAKKAKEEADRTTRDLEAKMAEAQRQAAQQLNQAKADAQKVADAIRTQAESESAALKDRTLREIDAAKQQAVSEINLHAAELGTAVARKILQRSVTAEDQQKLVEESLTEMAKKKLSSTMADNEFQIEAIGEVYAQALINEAQKQNALAEITEDVRGIGQLLRDNKAFHAFTQALTIGEEERLSSLDKIFSGRVHPLTLQVLLSISRRDRLMFLNGFVVGFEAILKKMSGHVDATIVSAKELPAAVVDRVKQAVGQSLGKTVDVNVKVDARLIGGMMLTIGDTLIDGSVATQLQKIKDQLKRGGKLKTESVVSSY